MEHFVHVILLKSVYEKTAFKLIQLFLDKGKAKSSVWAHKNVEQNVAL